MFEHICTTVVDDVSKLNYNVSFLLPHNEFCFNVIGLTIFMSNVHNRFMDDYGTSRGNGLVYGFHYITINSNELTIFLEICFVDVDVICS